MGLAVLPGEVILRWLRVTCYTGRAELEFIQEWIVGPRQRAPTPLRNIYIFIFELIWRGNIQGLVKGDMKEGKGLG